MPLILVPFWSWITESIKWKKRLDAEGLEVEVIQEELRDADLDPENVLVEDDAVDQAAKLNVDAQLQEDEGGEDVLQRNKWTFLWAPYEIFKRLHSEFILQFYKCVFRLQKFNRFEPD